MKNTGDRYDWQAMLTVTILGIIGVTVLYFAGLFDVRSINMFFEWIMRFGMLAIFCAFFIGVAIYCWVLYFKNVIFKPKQESLYLKSKEEGLCKFLDKKGKVFYFLDNEYVIDKYYDVLKTKDNIREVVGPATNTFDIPKERTSYWLNFYTPIGNFENIFLLPIVYIVMVPGITLLFSTTIIEKIFGMIINIPCILIILYDLKEKIKKKRG